MVRIERVKRGLASQAVQALTQVRRGVSCYHELVNEWQGGVIRVSPLPVPKQTYGVRDEAERRYICDKQEQDSGMPGHPYRTLCSSQCKPQRYTNRQAQNW